MGNRLAVYGAGGFGREVLAYCRDASWRDAPQVTAFIEDDPKSNMVDDIPIVPFAEASPSAFDNVVLAIGDAPNRARIAQALNESGFPAHPFIHPTAYVSPTARFSGGAFIGPFAAVGNNAELHHHVALNMYASCGHDSVVGNGSILSPYSTINGGAVLGAGVLLGTHAAILPRINVGAGAKVAAGAIVMKDVPPERLAMGVPARHYPLLPGGN